jgi:TusA-related sulfurtransferase
LGDRLKVLLDNSAAAHNDEPEFQHSTNSAAVRKAQPHANKTNANMVIPMDTPAEMSEF